MLKVHPLAGGESSPAPSLPSSLGGEFASASILAHLSSIFENTRDAIWSVDFDRRFVTFNSFMQERILAWWNVKIAHGTRHGGSSGPEADFWGGIYTRVLQGERVVAGKEYDRPDGIFSIEFSVNPICDRAGRIVGAAGIARDVTHLRKLDETIREREQDYRNILDSTGDPIWSVDREYRFITFNLFLQRIILAAQGKEITLGMNHLEVEAPADAESWKAAYERALAGEELKIQREYFTPPGHAIVEFSLNPIWEDDKVTGVACVGRDVTRMHEIAAALERSEQAYRVLFQDSPLPLWTVDLDTLLFSQFNRAALELYEYSAEELKEVSLLDIRPAQHRNRFLEVTLPDLRADRGDRHYYSQHTRKSGEMLDVEVYSHYLELEGRPSRLTLVKDITDQKRMEREILHERELAIVAKERAEEMNRLKTNFLANMSHEIRTPLTAILGFAELLHDEMIDPEKKAQAGMIQSSGNRLLETINQILDLARIEAGKVELNPISLPLAETIEECARLLRPLADKKGVRLNVRQTPRNLRAPMDKLYFNQVLTNLIGNAIKFTDSGQVEIVLDSYDSPDDVPQSDLRIGEASFPCAAIEVRDEGIGISKEFLPHIFDEFKQESAGYDRNYEGTGIGLTITAKLVELMRGAITVSSESGEGSRFIVQLPLAP